MKLPFIHTLVIARVFACSTFYSGYGNERDYSLCIVVAIAIMMSSDSLPFSSIAYLSHTLSFSSQGRVPLVKLHTLHGTTERAQCSQDRSHWVAFLKFIAAETAQWRDSACCRRMMSVSQQGQPSLRSGRVFGIPFQAHRFAKNTQSLIDGPNSRHPSGIHSSRPCGVRTGPASPRAVLPLDCPYSKRKPVLSVMLLLLIHFQECYCDQSKSLLLLRLLPSNGCCDCCA